MVLNTRLILRFEEKGKIFLFALDGFSFGFVDCMVVVLGIQ